MPAADFRWVAKQEEFLQKVSRESTHADANQTSSRYLYLGGRPGTGKTAVLCEAALRAAREGLHVCVLVPTGSLVYQSRSRVPEHDRRVETLHSGLRIGRGADKLVRYSPPGRFRRYDLYLVDEVSQIQDAVLARFFMCLLLYLVYF